MRSSLLRFTSLFLASFFLFSCEKETETIQTEQISEYVSPQPGKYIIYRTDSTVFTNFGRDEELHSYHEKHVVDALITDNLGRQSYRVFRFIRDTSGLEPWKSSGTYFITPLQNTLELVEDNLRFIKLALPLREDFSWKGNTHLPYEPFSNEYNFSNDDNIADWNYTVSSMGETMNFNGETVHNIITIDQVNEAINVPITIPTAYAAINYAVDKFAKGLGLVYQELIMWEYQPNPGGPSPYQVGFGVKRSMIDHN